MNRNEIITMIRKHDIADYGDGRLNIRNTKNIKPEEIETIKANKEEILNYFAEEKAERKATEEATVNFRVMGWEPISTNIDTRHDIDEQLHNIAKHHGTTYELVKEGYERAIRKEVEREVNKKAELEEIIKAAETTHKNDNGTLMTEAQYKAWRRKYNNLYNEGGDGYIPDVITQERYEWALKQL